MIPYDMQAPVAVRCLWTNCYTLPLPLPLPAFHNPLRLSDVLCTPNFCYGRMLKGLGLGTYSFGLGLKMVALTTSRAFAVH